MLVLIIGHVKILPNRQSLNSLNVIKVQFCHRQIFTTHFYKQVDEFGMKKLVKLKKYKIFFWIFQIFRGKFTRVGLIDFFWIFFSHFRFHIKDSKWERKCVFMNCASSNGSLQQILLRQLPFANEAKPHSHCREFCALSETYLMPMSIEAV